jgi:hypothetical protein
VEVVRDEIVVAMFFDSTDEGGESAGITKGVSLDLLEDPGEIGIEGV